MRNLSTVLDNISPIGTLLRYRAALYFLVQGGAGDAKVFGDFHLGTPRRSIASICPR
nr:hypothetical protein [Centipeda periodontii]